MAESVQISMLKGQILALSEAIVAIHNAVHECDRGLIDPEDVDEVIWSAVDLLDDEYRPIGYTKRKTSVASFEDML